MLKNTFKNPLLSGFYPDPSICRVGEDYYLVTSSFVYYPGLPIFHSRDLVHWEQIGHAIHRPDQLDYKNCETSLGLWAPSIRYHKVHSILSILLCLRAEKPDVITTL